VPRRVIDDLSKIRITRAFALRAGDYPSVALEDTLGAARSRNERPFLLGWTAQRPQNFGALLLRVADAVACTASAAIDGDGVT